jgi:hypothetical protein
MKVPPETSVSRDINFFASVEVSMPAFMLPHTVTKHPLKSSIRVYWSRFLATVDKGVNKTLFVYSFFTDLNAQIVVSSCPHPQRLLGTFSLLFKQHSRLFHKEGRQGVIWLKLKADQSRS